MYVHALVTKRLTPPHGSSTLCHRFLGFQHRYMWHSIGSVDLHMNKSGRWHEIPDMELSIFLSEPASIRVLYSMTIMSEHVLHNEGKRLSLMNLSLHQYLLSVEQSSSLFSIPIAHGICVYYLLPFDYRKVCRVWRKLVGLEK